MLRYFLAAIIACTLCAPGFADTNQRVAYYASVASKVYAKGELLHGEKYSKFHSSIVSFYAYNGAVYRCYFSTRYPQFGSPIAQCIDQYVDFDGRPNFNQIQKYLLNPLKALGRGSKKVGDQVINGEKWTFHKRNGNLWLCAVKSPLFLVCKQNEDLTNIDLGI